MFLEVVDRKKVTSTRRVNEKKVVKVDLTVLIILLTTRPSTSLLLSFQNLKALCLPRLEPGLLVLVLKDWLCRLASDTIAESNHLYLQWVYLI
jgi:hypothetical protein